MSRSTGFLSLVSGLEKWVVEERKWGDLEVEEEKKRNAKVKAAARERQVVMRREMSRIFGVVGFEDWW